MKDETGNDYQDIPAARHPCLIDIVIPMGGVMSRTVQCVCIKFHTFLTKASSSGDWFYMDNIKVTEENKETSSKMTIG
ncbi:hypothetical protein TNCT_326731 [Trichonephila clavata]|uniref:Uncharacterized protein n=1 Tax=Trichonephila clavata TaxID=2740835 RepID=A0A8X6LMJ3_TRICU|nr:hypothetical protein TNCT_326731 [Trichonephila clavata]